MTDKKYLMENADEIRRLEMKTGFSALKNQAVWAGLKPGMRVLDIGCGSGKTTRFLKTLSGEKGSVLGLDRSGERIEYAQKKYRNTGIQFVCKDVYNDLGDLGYFDFIWARFFLEYHKAKSADLVETFSRLLLPGGIMCLIDLDHNSLNHYGLPSRLFRAVNGCVRSLEERADFDPYIGRKLYSFLYDLHYRDINVHVGAHHLLFGEIHDTVEFNLITKVTVAGRDSGYSFEEYPGGYDEFYHECRKYLADPRRFTYSPLISCRGVKPSE